MNIEQNSKLFISLIIPTRERAETLLFAIKTALDQKSDAYEVIVCDNFSQDNTKQVVQSFNDPRLIYVNPGKRLSMSDNWEFALEYAKGDYVIFIGDDDAVMPGAIDKLQNTIQDKPSQVYFWPRTVYTWPKNNQKASVSCLLLDAYPSGINLKKLAKFIISIGGGRSTFLPSVYYSAVKKDILYMMKKQTGRVFHSTQPDIFLALSIPAFADYAVNTGYTVTVVGQSPKSNSGVIFYGRDGVQNYEKFMKEYGNYKINPTLYPGVNVLANLLPDTMLIAMEKYPQLYENMHFNYNAAWAYMLQHSKYFKWDVTMKEILQKRRQIRQYHPFSVLQFFKYYILYKSAALYRDIFSKAADLGPFSKDVPDNISDFVKRLADYQLSLVKR